ncbi:MAG: hypothetical protein COB98_08505 [Flavobacteriaceae bacterium]|nr:MAG: hypothetical protein COB98_08505 [Flavobacteriaceae bacterium]
MSETTINILFMLIGVFAIVASVLEWNFFFNSKKAQGLIAILGRKGTKIFYIVIGVGLLLVGFLDMMDIIDVPLKFGRR